jgi:hypothetical protein
MYEEEFSFILQMLPYLTPVMSDDAPGKLLSYLHSMLCAWVTQTPDLIITTRPQVIHAGQFSLAI